MVTRVLRLRLERGMETPAMNQLSRQFLGGFPAVENAEQHDRLACRLQSVHRTVASRSHTIRSCSFSFSSIISGVLDRFTDLREAFFEGGVG